MSVVGAPLSDLRASRLQFTGCTRVLCNFSSSCNDVIEYLKTVSVLVESSVMSVYGWELVPFWCYQLFALDQQGRTDTTN